MSDPIINSAEIADEAIDKIEGQIPNEYLIKCEWFLYLQDYATSKIDPRDVLKVHEENMQRANRCFAVHNKLVDFINNRDGL